MITHDHFQELLSKIVEVTLAKYLQINYWLGKRNSPAVLYKIIFNLIPTVVKVIDEQIPLLIMILRTNTNKDETYVLKSLLKYSKITIMYLKSAT